MNLNSLTAISPVDGRYRNKIENLDLYFSEYGLIKYRVQVEIEYFISLCRIPLPELKAFHKEHFKQLRQIYEDFTLEDARKVKEIEKSINHDVKAVEYFLKNKLTELGFSQYKEFVHFGLTSQDINNTAVPLSLREAFHGHYLPDYKQLYKTLESLAQAWKDIPMLAHTHGQPASPTRVGKEFMVFCDRLQEQMRQLKQIPFSAKFGGATGNFNAHHFVYPDINWVQFADHFVNSELGLRREKITTQIDHYDNLASFFQAMIRINTILIDLSKDMWTYISMNYFKQKIQKGEVGSSVMPHKVNPIDFENAEGNLGMANAIMEHIALKLPVSRLQRDLTDSTVLRNIGMPFAHSLIAFKALNKGLQKLTLNKTAIDEDLDNNWSVIAEALQTTLRKEGTQDPYELLKDFTRQHKKITQDDFIRFIDQLDVDETVKTKLKKLNPWNYTGLDLF